MKTYQLADRRVWYGPLDNRFQKSKPIVGFEDLGRHHAVTLYALVHVAPSALRRCYRVPARREQHALIEPADAYQHCAESDERKRSEYSCQAGHIDKENLGDGQGHDRCRRKPRRLRSQEEAGKEQKHSKYKPDRRVGILLGVARRAPRQNWPVVKRSY